MYRNEFTFIGEGLLIQELLNMYCFRDLTFEAMKGDLYFKQKSFEEETMNEMFKEFMEGITSSTAFFGSVSSIMEMTFDGLFDELELKSFNN